MNKYTSEERNEILNHIIEYSKKYQEIVGAIIVGSGADNFLDEYSDIDILIITGNDIDLVSFSESYKNTIFQKEMILSYALSIRGEGIFLHNFFLNNYLEINLCIHRLQNLSARKPKYKIIYDRTNTMESIMQKTKTVDQKKELTEYIGRVIPGLWHYVNKVYSAIQRGNVYFANKTVEHIRNIVIDIELLKANTWTVQSKHLDKLNEEFLSKIEDTMCFSHDKKKLNKTMTVLLELLNRQIIAIEDIDNAYSSIHNQLLSMFDNQEDDTNMI